MEFHWGKNVKTKHNVRVYKKDHSAEKMANWFDATGDMIDDDVKLRINQTAIFP